MTMVQVYVPGLSPVAVTCAVSATPCGELPTAAFEPSTQLTVDCVPLGASEVALARTSVSGVSVKV